MNRCRTAFPVLMAVLALIVSPASGQETTAPTEPRPDSALRIIELRKHLLDDPLDGDAHTELGILYAEEDLLDEARSSFISALQAAPTLPQSHLNLGLILVRMERWGEALGSLQTYATMTPASGHGPTLVGDAHKAAGNLELARETWLLASAAGQVPVEERVELRRRAAQTFVEDEPDMPQVIELVEADAELLAAPEGQPLRELQLYGYIEQAKAHEEAGESQEALDAYARARAANLSDRSIYLTPIQTHITAGSLDQAEHLLTEARTRLNGDAALLSFLEGRIAEQKGELETAAKAFRTTRQEDADFPGVYSALGGVLARLGDADGAAEALAQAVEKGQGGAASSYNLGVTLIQNENFAGAIPHLKAAILADPTLKAAYRALGGAYRKTEKHAEAAQTYEQILTKFGPDSRDYLQLAQAQFKNDDFKGAAQNYEMVTALEPRGYVAHYQLGRALLKLGRASDAAGAFAKARDIDPTKSAARYNHAFALQKAGRYEEAIEIYLEAAEVKESYNIYVNVAICYKELGDKKTSDQYYKLANELKKKS